MKTIVINIVNKLFGSTFSLFEFKFFVLKSYRIMYTLYKDFKCSIYIQLTHYLAIDQTITDFEWIFILPVLIRAC